MDEIDWRGLSVAFRKLTMATVEGGKTSDGTMLVIFSNSFMYENPEAVPISVEFYAYGMPEMNKHHRLGPYNEELQAFQEARALLQKQVRFINFDRAENGMMPIDWPFAIHETPEEAVVNQDFFDKHRGFEA